MFPRLVKDETTLALALAVIMIVLNQLYKLTT